MSVYLTGDLHGNIDFQKINTFRDRMKDNLTKEDYLIILGDFGLVWYPSDNLQHPEYLKQEKLLTKLESYPWTTLFIDGNHENFDLLNQLPRIEKFQGSVGVVRDGIYHLRRNQFYTIENKVFYTFGGGLSIDKQYRILGKSYWEQELPTMQEMNEAIDLISSMEKKSVDYILTHEAPRKFINHILDLDPSGTYERDDLRPLKFKSPLAQMFDVLWEMLEFKQWFCGHYHEDKKILKLQALYQKIVNLEDYK